jgi:hypothetical protein
MDTELLVEEMIDDGRMLVAELIKEGFDVTVAFWVKTDEGLWYLYIGSTSVESGRVGDAYIVAYDCLTRIPRPSISLSDIKLVPATNPIAQAATEIRDRYADRTPTRYHGKQLGRMAIEEAYIYPQPGKWFKGFDEIKAKFPTAEALSIIVSYPGSAGGKKIFPQGFAPYMGKINDRVFEGRATGTVLFLGPEASNNPSKVELVFVHRPEGWNTVYQLTSGAVQNGFRPEVRSAVAEKPVYEAADFGPFSAAKILS